MKPRLIGSAIGQASAIKMLHTIIIKGSEVLTAEYFVVACAAGVTDEALATRQASDPGFDWTVPSAYNLKPMAPIGTRRATEMREAAWFLADLDLPHDVSVATATSQNRIGDLGLELEGTEARGSAALALTALRGDP